MKINSCMSGSAKGVKQAFNFHFQLIAVGFQESRPHEEMSMQGVLLGINMYGREESRIRTREKPNCDAVTKSVQPSHGSSRTGVAPQRCPDSAKSAAFIPSC